MIPTERINFLSTDIKITDITFISDFRLTQVFCSCFAEHDKDCENYGNTDEPPKIIICYERNGIKCIFEAEIDKYTFRKRENNE